ncbi:MAG: hypothetical protein ABSH44_25830, partial [Bryobacteraceae bacterium]
MTTAKAFPLLVLLLVSGATCRAGHFVAYSLRGAESRLRQSTKPADEVSRLGGITRVAGLVFDPAHKDWIVVGEAGDGNPASLDNLVVAMRSVLVHKAWPAVSIDKTRETNQTRLQAVRFEGGIANTAFGKEFLEADVVLKKLALGNLPAGIWGVRSYLDLSVERMRSQAVEEAVSSRFWFDVVGECLLAQREGVVAIGELRLGVLPQVTSVNGKAVAPGSQTRDELADQFASAMTTSFQEISEYYPEVGRLRALFDFLALARGLASQASEADLRYFLKEYAVAAEPTPTTYGLLERREEMTMQGQTRVLRLDGGVELRALVSMMKDGDPAALRDTVLRSRPKGDPLTWPVPLDAWPMPGSRTTGVEFERDREASLSSLAAQLGIGTSVTRRIGVPGSVLDRFDPQPPSTPAPALMPKFNVAGRLPSQVSSTNVGGVLLGGTARVPGAPEASVDLSRGNFSLIVEGQGARLAPETFRKFITAL